uniref:Frizzled-4 n=1 Tax=Macrostomum lignano TaxID=282301 RepID=A0A1I8IQQ4_9PLAT
AEAATARLQLQLYSKFKQADVKTPARKEPPEPIADRAKNKDERIEMSLQPLHCHLLLLILLASPAAIAALEFSQHKCEPISIEVCQNIGYNQTTKLQNLAGHSDPRDAEVLLSTFSPLISYQCSRNLKFFLCSVLMPMCDAKWPKPIGPCRPLCERVQHRCLPVLEKFGFKWPTFLNCTRFPISNQRGDDMCMEGSPESDLDDSSTSNRTAATCATTGSTRTSTTLATARCAATAMICSAREDKRLADIWIGVLASLCAFSSLATILTFLIDRPRFKYPVRPVVFMALCYLCYSISYFVRLIAGRETAACDRDPLTGQLVLIRQGLDNTNCAVVFLLQYFFSTAANVWYVILVFTWLLQAGWKWSPEAVAKRSCYFHLPAWILPVGLTVAVLILRRVEADELFGMCNVGHQSSDMLLGFVIVPNLLFLLLEAVFLVAGFVAMSRVRRHVKSDGQKTNKFDVLMGKIGLFSALYIVPTACLTGFNFYEFSNRDLWHLPGSPFRPSVAAFLIKVFASLAIGLTTVLWIWSCK